MEAWHIKTPGIKLRQYSRIALSYYIRKGEAEIKIKRTRKEKQIKCENTQKGVKLNRMIQCKRKKKNYTMSQWQILLLEKSAPKLSDLQRTEPLPLSRNQLADSNIPGTKGVITLNDCLYSYSVVCHGFIFTGFGFVFGMRLWVGWGWIWFQVRSSGGGGGRHREQFQIPSCWTPLSHSSEWPRTHSPNLSLTVILNSLLRIYSCLPFQDIHT